MHPAAKKNGCGWEAPAICDSKLFSLKINSISNTVQTVHAGKFDSTWLLRVQVQGYGRGTGGIKRTG